MGPGNGAESGMRILNLNPLINHSRASGRCPASPHPLTWTGSLMKSHPLGSCRQRNSLRSRILLSTHGGAIEIQGSSPEPGSNFACKIMVDPIAGRCPRHTLADRVAEVPGCESRARLAVQILIMRNAGSPRLRQAAGPSAPRRVHRPRLRTTLRGPGVLLDCTGHSSRARVRRAPAFVPARGSRLPFLGPGAMIFAVFAGFLPQVSLRRCSGSGRSAW